MTPKISFLFGSICFVKSGLIVQLSPRSTDLNSLLPPMYSVCGSCGDNMNGVVQFHRKCSFAAGAGAILLGAFAVPTRGWIEAASPFPMSSRRIDPRCPSAYTMCQSLGSFAVYCPSPLPTLYQSCAEINGAPTALGPHQLELSCSPPHT